jgi:hypothetical protein
MFEPNQQIHMRVGGHRFDVDLKTDPQFSQLIQEVLSGNCPFRIPAFESYIEAARASRHEAGD